MQLVITLAMNQLTSTNRTTFNVTAKNVILAFDNSAIMARLPICSPIFCFLTIPDALPLDALD